MTPLLGALGVAAASKFLAKHDTLTSVALSVAVFIVLLLMLSAPKTRVQEEQKSIGGFSVTGSGAP